jgi:hypothetical protein
MANMMTSRPYRASSLPLSHQFLPSILDEISRRELEGALMASRAVKSMELGQPWVTEDVAARMNPNHPT